MIFVSGAEPAQLRAIGTSSNLPEDYGVDFLWWDKEGKSIGVQRKAFPGDLLSSFADGRMSTLIGKAQGLDVRVMLLEGTPMFTDAGELMFEYGRLTAEGLRNFEWSIQVNHGFELIWTQTMADTATTIRTLHDYSTSGQASSLSNRTGKGWKDLSSPEFQTYLLQSVPGVAGKAKTIVKALDGLPVRWYGDRDELLAIPGVGNVLADRIIEAFGGSENGAGR